jgi:hypothetical protein
VQQSTRPHHPYACHLPAIDKVTPVPLNNATTTSQYRHTPIQDNGTQVRKRIGYKMFKCMYYMMIFTNLILINDK